MTRSSTSELFTPYKEPKREFQSSRNHFKTLSLDELRSPDLNLFSDQEYKLKYGVLGEKCRVLGENWKNDGYCNGGNLPGAYIVGNSLHYQDYEWYEALMDCKLKEQALRNKAIMEGLISDDESSNNSWRRWQSHEITYYDLDEIEYENETHDERQELYEVYNAVKEDEYDDLAKTSDDACRAYQEILHMMDEGWMVTSAE
ncbi:hypothetical protein Tco_0508182 [Tanacetum coccineum]